MIARSHGWVMAVVGRFEACQLNACVAWPPERRGTGASWPVGKGPEASGRLDRTTSIMPSVNFEASTEPPLQPRSTNSIGKSAPKNRSPVPHA